MLRQKKHRQVAEINVVPYIDVMLVLLIIFMVTAPLMFQGVDVELPTANAKPIEQKSEEPIVVSVDAFGNYYLNISTNPAKPISSDDLFAKITDILKPAQGKSKRQVLIKADKKNSYEKVIQAMVLLQKAGAPSVGLITQLDN